MARKSRRNRSNRTVRAAPSPRHLETLLQRRDETLEHRALVRAYGDDIPVPDLYRHRAIRLGAVMTG